MPRAWDGSGHYGIAQIYAQSIFPDTFGWTNAHLGGMPFPHFYPRLFFWCVAFLVRTHLFSFMTAFKLIVILPPFSSQPLYGFWPGQFRKKTISSRSGRHW